MEMLKGIIRGTLGGLAGLAIGFLIAGTIIVSLTDMTFDDFFGKCRSVEFSEMLMSIGVAAIAFPLSYIILVPIHEAGHLVCGLLSGYKFVSFRIFNITFIKLEGKLRVKRFAIAGTGGQCLLTPPDLPLEKIPTRLYNFGGILANLIVLFIALPLLWINGHPFVQEATAMFIIADLIILIMNGIPMKISGLGNDAYNMGLLKKNPASKLGLVNMLRTNALIQNGIRPKDMPAELFNLPSSTNSTDLPVPHSNTHNSDLPVQHPDTLNSDLPVPHPDTLNSDLPVPHPDTHLSDLPVPHPDNHHSDHPFPHPDTHLSDNPVPHPDTHLSDNPVPHPGTLNSDLPVQHPDIHSSDDPGRPLTIDYTNQLEVILPLMQASRLIDEMRYKEALDKFEELYTHKDHIIPLYVKEIACELVYLRLINGDKEGAKELLTPELRKYIETYRKVMSSKERILSAISLMIDNDMAKALSIYDTLRRRQNDYLLQGEVRSDLALLTSLLSPPNPTPQPYTDTTCYSLPTTIPTQPNAP